MLPCDSKFSIVDDNRHLGFGSVLNVSGSARPRVWAQGLTDHDERGKLVKP